MLTILVSLQLDKIQERLVKQFHYTAWPDHGVPSSPSSLLNFVRKSSAANPPNAGPMVSASLLESRSHWLTRWGII